MSPEYILSIDAVFLKIIIFINITNKSKTNTQITIIFEKGLYIQYDIRLLMNCTNFFEGKNFWPPNNHNVLYFPSLDTKLCDDIWTSFLR